MSFWKSTVYEMAVTGRPPSIAVVTGAKSGIGLALRRKIASFPFIEQIVAVSRTITAADVTNDDPKCVAVAADIATADGRAAVVDKVKELCAGGGGGGGGTTKQVRFLIHSAGTIDPIKPILDLELHELENAIKVNVEGPLFLTTALHAYLQPITADGVAGRVLHVSSGAAHGAPPVGWGTYGITKAAFFQSFRVLERELRGTGVVVGSFKPGVVDTNMQGNIRNASPDAMPMVQNFIHLKAKVQDSVPTQARPPPPGALDSPDNVAFFAEFLLLGTTDEEFANAHDDNEWDIRNKANFARWILPERLPPKEE